MSSSTGGISRYVGTAWATVIAVAAVTAGAIGIPAVTGGGGGAENTANLWVDDNGGTCTDNTSLTAYSDAAACSSMDAAYDAAECGDTVRIKAHRTSHYLSQTIGGTQKNCTGNTWVTFMPAAGETVTVGPTPSTGDTDYEGTVAFCDADWVKILATRTGADSTFEIVDDGTIEGHAGFTMGSGGCQFGLSERVDHIYIEGTSFETYLVRGADQISFVDNDISAGKSDDHDETIFVSNGYDGSYRDNYSTDLLLERNDIYNFDSSECVSDNPTCHIECLTGAFENITIRRNRIYGCGNTAAVIFGQDGGFATKGTQNLVENNLIHDSENVPLQIGDTESGSVITFRFNTIRRTGGSGTSTPDGGTIAGTVHMVGNLLETGNGWSCSVINGDWLYNVVGTGSSGCATGGTGNSFGVTTSFASAIPDFHLSAAQTAIDKVPDATCTVTEDLDGDPRPAGQPCDAGADERTG